MILILADDTDELAADVARRLVATGKETCRIGADWRNLQIRWELPDAGFPGYLQWEDRRVPLSELSGVLVRILPPVRPMFGEESDEEYLQLEWNTAVVGLLSGLSCQVVSTPRPMVSRRQPWLWGWRRELAEAELKLPDMRVTASPVEVAEYCRQGRVIGIQREGPLWRSEAGGLPPAPACLVALPAGVGRRVWVVGNEAWASEGELPKPLAARSIRAVQLLGLRFAAVELISNADGDWVWEVDEFPQFAGCGAVTRAKVLDALAVLLSGEKGGMA